MPFKTKSIMTKAGDRYSIVECKLDKEVKASPLSPKLIDMFRSEEAATESAKKRSKEENKALNKKVSERNKQQHKNAQKQKSRQDK